MYKNIIIRVDGEEESRKVQEKLFAAGNMWCSGLTKYLPIPYDLACIYTGNGNDMTHSSIDYYLEDGDPAKLVSFKDFMEIGQKQEIVVKKPPIGVKPKAIVDKERTKEILEAMLRYVEGDVKVPREWLTELGVIIDLE